MTGNVHDSNPVNKFLRVVVPANLTSCLDEANYTCLLNAQDKDHANYEDQVSRYVGVKSTILYLFIYQFFLISSLFFQIIFGEIFKEH